MTQDEHKIKNEQSFLVQIEIDQNANYMIIFFSSFTTDICISIFYCMSRTIQICIEIVVQIFQKQSYSSYEFYSLYLFVVMNTEKIVQIKYIILFIQEAHSSLFRGLVRQRTHYAYYSIQFLQFKYKLTLFSNLRIGIDHFYASLKF